MLCILFLFIFGCITYGKKATVMKNNVSSMVEVYTDNEKKQRLKFKDLCKECICGKDNSYLMKPCDEYGEDVPVKDGEYPIEYFTSGSTYNNFESLVYGLSEEGVEYFQSLN